MIRFRRSLVLALALAAPASAAAREDQGPRPTLELSLEDAVDRALRNNLDIAIEKLGPQAEEKAVEELEATYTPLFTADLGQRSRTDPPTTALIGGERVGTDVFMLDVGAEKALRSGGRLRLEFDNSRARTGSIFATFSPSFESSLGVTLTQPLLRNRKTDERRFRIAAARKSREIADQRLQQAVVNTVARVKHRYYDLRYAADNLEVQRRSLALADRLVEESRAQLRVGTAARLDLQAAESERASREEAVIVAEGALADAEDALKRSIFPDDEPGLWPLRLVAAGRPSAEPVELDVEAAVQVALDRRTDMRAAQKALESADLSLAYAHNQRLPCVDLVASYVARGLGGTEIVRQRLAGPVLQEIRGGYGGALRDVWGLDFPAWRLEVSVARPFSNRQAEAAAARAGLDQEVAATRIRRLRLRIASEVRSAARAVETNLRRMASTRAAQALQERRMEAEQKRFEAGLSTSFLVTQSQRDLAVAAAAELKAITDYRKSLVSFERVQEAGDEVDAGGSEPR